MGLLPSPIESLEPEESLHSQMEVLLEFRAGKMVMDGRRVHADPRKGLVRVVRTEDSLVHFQWLDVGMDAVEEDQIVLPEEATFEKVSQSSGRVYILKFKHDDRKFFYWMQGPRVDEDQDNCENVKHLLNQPLYADEEEEEEVNLQSTSAASGSTKAAEAFTRDVNMADFQDQALPLSVGAVQMADLQRILHGLGEMPIPQGNRTSSNVKSIKWSISQTQVKENTDTDEEDNVLCGSSRAPAEEFYRDTGLSFLGVNGPTFTDIFKPEIVLPLLDSRTLKDRLVPFLPEGVETPEAVGDLMRSPQFQQQLDMFAHVLRTGQLDWAQFGINPTNYNFTVSSFLEAIEDQTISASETNSEATHNENKPEKEHDREGQRDEKRTSKDDDVMEEDL